MRWPNAQTCEPRPHGPTVSLPPGDGLPRRRGQCFGQSTDRERTSTPGASHQLWWSSQTTVGERAERLGTRSPHRRLTGDPHHVGNPLLRKSIAEGRDHAESRVRHHRRQRQPLTAQPGDLLQRNLPLRLERYLLGNRGLLPTPTIVDPDFRKIETIRGGDAHRFIGHRHRDRDLAIVLLAERTTVLPHHTDRVLALLRDACVVHDPSRHRAVPLHLLQDVVAGHPQDRFVVPGRIGHEVVHGLMPRAHMPRIHTSGHRLDALALAGQAQAHEIPSQRLHDDRRVPPPRPAIPDTPRTACPDRRLSSP